MCLRKLEVESAVDGDKAKEGGEQYCADDGDDDAADHSVFADAAEAEVAGEVSADQGADEAYKHVDEDAVAGAFHDFAGDPSGDETDEKPGKQAVAERVIQSMIHSFLFSCRVRCNRVARIGRGGINKGEVWACRDRQGSTRGVGRLLEGAQ